MTMLIHEVVTFSCYLVSHVKYKNHIPFNKRQSNGMVNCIVVLQTVFLHFAGIKGKVSL